MGNYRIILQYEGTKYQGWQRQDSTDNTIQGKIEAILYKWSGEEIEIHGSGRTDAGVHARGQVANFHIDQKICPNEKTAMEYLNQYLPEDVRVLSAEEMPDRFHSRLLAVRKTYSYSVDMAPKKSVFERKYVWGLGEHLDLAAMRMAAEYFVGEHDFKSFCSAKTQVTDTTRTVYSLDLWKEGNQVKLRITGNGFLYNMVRIMVGTVLDIGLGRKSIDSIPQALATQNRHLAGRTAPASGLYLCDVYYRN